METLDIGIRKLLPITRGLEPEAPEPSVALWALHQGFPV